MPDPAIPHPTSREALVNALSAAADLEHALLVQYLFAAFSLRQRPAPGCSERQCELARSWARTLLAIARSEMAHLGTVCNMLTAVGGRPQFSRSSVGAAHGWGRAFRFQLERFGEQSLRRFVRFEAPVGLERLKPETVPFDWIGQLYAGIAEGFRHLAATGAQERRLFCGPPEAQDASDWSSNLTLRPVRDLRTALTAIQFIRWEGEGDTAASSSGSHYESLRAVLGRFRDERDRDPAFDPAKPVAPNPVTSLPLDEEGLELPAPPGLTYLPPGSPARPVAELGNALYGTVLRMLVQLYDYGGETPRQRAGLQANIRRSMSGIVRPLGELLTELPVAEGSPHRAGPGFELYSEVEVPSHIPSRWIVLQERLEAAADECLALSRLGEPLLHRLGFIATNLGLLRDNVAELASAGTTAPARRASTAGPSAPRSTGPMLSIHFRGWLQCRLATDPDPADEPRGVSGWTFAVAGEPDLDRVLRLQPEGTTRRAGGPVLGVTVRSVSLGSQALAGHRLDGGAVELLDDPVFEGRNGLAAEDGREPIFPFHLRVSGGGVVLRREHRDPQTGAFRKQSPVGMGQMPDLHAILEGKTTLAYRTTRRRDLDALRASSPEGSTAWLALDKRIRDIDESLEGRTNLVNAGRSLRWAFRYEIPLEGPWEVDDPAGALGVALGPGPWTARFWVGAWDADALCAYMLGQLEIPVAADADGRRNR